MIEPAKAKDAPFASLAHGLAIFFPYLGPLAVLVLFHRSPYVRFHAAWALVGQLAYTFWLALFIAANLGYSIYRLIQINDNGFEWSDLWGVLIKSVVVYLLLGLFTLINTVANVIQAVKAFRGGYWGGTGWTARLSRKISGASQSVS